MCMNRLKVLLFAALGACSLQATAQSYPTKPVQVILAFTPGSAVDIVGRIVTAKVSEMWGQPIINDNRSGAGGSIGSAVGAPAGARGGRGGLRSLCLSQPPTGHPGKPPPPPPGSPKGFPQIWAGGR